MLTIATFSHVNLKWRKWSIDKEGAHMPKEAETIEEESPDITESLILIISKAQRNSGSVRHP
jgi:hypothetical protein